MGSDTTTSINWYGVIISSTVIAAFISSAINIGWNAYHESRKRKREDAKENKRIAHVYLGITLELEIWAKQLDGYLYQIGQGLWERASNHDESHLQKLKSPQLTFDHTLNWEELPVDFVARVKALVPQLATTDHWIMQQFEWADLDEMYTWEEERVAYHGLKICTIATDTRARINAGVNEEINSWIDHFQGIIDDRKKQFEKSKTSFIPELQAQFNEETTSLRRMTPAS